MNSFAEHIKAVFFDHDDTLVATIEAKWAEHKHIANTFYNKQLTDDEIREHWGKPFTTIVSLLYETTDIETAVEHNKRVHSDFPKKLHDDTIDTLKKLHGQGKKLGVITATSRFSFNYDLKSMSVPLDLFDYIQTEEDTPYHKPDFRVFEPALAWLKSLSIKPEEVLYVGDGLHDMKAALGAGFEFMGVSTGLVTQEEFESDGAKSIKKLSDLLKSPS